MSNENLIEFAKIAIGVLVSILLFVSTYRKTIGAKKERVTNANKDVEKILIRRIALENYSPTLVDVARLLEGKARDYRVGRGDLLSEEQILNLIYIRIVESELLTSSQRKEIILRIEPFLNQIEGAPLVNDETKPISSESVFRKGTIYVAFMAGTSSILGGVVAYTSDLVQSTSSLENLAKAFFGTVAISVVLIAIISFYYWLKSSQEKDSTKSQELEQYLRFEEDMNKLIKELDQGHGVSIEDISSKDIEDIDKKIEMLLKEGDIFEVKPGKLKVLE